MTNTKGSPPLSRGRRLDLAWTTCPRERLTSGNLATLIRDKHVVGGTTKPDDLPERSAPRRVHDDQVRDLSARAPMWTQLSARSPPRTAQRVRPVPATRISARTVWTAASPASRPPSAPPDRTCRGPLDRLKTVDRPNRW